MGSTAFCSGSPAAPKVPPGNPRAAFGVSDSDVLLRPLRALGKLGPQALSEQREEETPTWCSATMKGSYPFSLRKGINDLDTRWLYIH